MPTSQMNQSNVSVSFSVENGKGVRISERKDNDGILISSTKTFMTKAQMLVLLAQAEQQKAIAEKTITDFKKVIAELEK